MPHYPPQRSYGKNYDNTLSTTDVAKKIRSFIAQKRREGVIPKELKYSVRSKSYSGGSSIDIDITSVPRNMVIYNPKTCSKERGYGISCKKYNPKLQKINDMISKKMRSYNFDGSDSQTDYYDVNFHGFGPDLNWKLQNYAINQIKGCIDERGISQPTLCDPIIHTIKSRPSSPAVTKKNPRL